MKFSIKGICSILIIAAVAMYSCKGNSTSENTQDTDTTYHFDDAELDEVVVDSVEGEKVSHECAIMAYHLDELTEDLKKVESPYMLMKFRAKYPSLLKDAMEGIEELKGEEQEAIRNKLAQLRDDYLHIGRQYEVEADGVISQIETMTEQVEKANDAESFARFENSYYSNLHNLDILYLCANQESARIQELRRKATKLKALTESRRHQFANN